MGWGEVFREVREDGGLVFLGKRAEGGSVKRGRWLGCGGKIFREVRADIWLVFLGRRSGGEVWREGGGWAVGEVFREQSGRKWGGVLRRKGWSLGRFLRK